ALAPAWVFAIAFSGYNGGFSLRSAFLPVKGTSAGMVGAILTLGDGDVDGDGGIDVEEELVDGAGGVGVTAFPLVQLANPPITPITNKIARISQTILSIMPEPNNQH